MAEATIRFDHGAESVTVHLPVELPSGGVPLSGNVSGTFGDCFVAGDLNLTGDLFIEGVMTGIDTFHIQGNGHTVFFQDGGRADLHGKFKAPWGPWGTSTTGWLVGDRLAVAPTAVGKFAPSELVWSNWGVSRPANSPDVTQVGGTVAKPEVANLSQSIVIENLGRGFHFHDSAGVQSLSDVKFLNCGTTGILGNYPCHFHLLGDNSRGSMIERVVVEGGKNHAFVPHGSHGISLKDCVAYNIIEDAYWWDPGVDGGPIPSPNDSDDNVWQHVLALKVIPIAGTTNHRLTAFHLGTGIGNQIVNSAAVGVLGGKDSSGFQWPESGSDTWLFDGCVAHNNKSNGIFVWQNSFKNHVIENYAAYRNGKAGVEHGAYRNQYRYDNLTLTGNLDGMVVHALSKPGAMILIENVRSDTRLFIERHIQPAADPVVYRTCTFPAVKVDEIGGGGIPGFHIFEDCGLVPAVFDLAGIHPDSIIEIFEGGVLAHRWAGGWS